MTVWDVLVWAAAIAGLVVIVIAFLVMLLLVAGDFAERHYQRQVSRQPLAPVVPLRGRSRWG